MGRPNMEKSGGEPMAVRVFPVKIKVSDNDQKIENLTLKLWFFHHPDHGQTLMVQITCENDPFLLYELHINSVEFHNLSKQQSLTVEFLDFPTVIVELIDSCMKPQHSSTLNFDNISMVSHAESRFVSQTHLVTSAQLLVKSSSTADATLNFIESKGFRETVLLSLCTRKGNDSAVKDYLAKRLREFKTLSENLSGKVSNLETQLDFNNQELGRLREDLIQTKSTAERDLSNVEHSHRKKIQEMDIDHSQKNSALERHLKEIHSAEQKKLQERLTAETERREGLENDLEVLEKKYEVLDSNDRANRQSLSNERERLSRIEKELAESRERYSQTAEQLRIADATIGEIRGKLEVAVETQRQLEQRLEQSARLEVIAADQLKQYEENLTHTKALLEAEKEKSLKFASEVQRMDVSLNERQLDNKTIRTELKSMKKEMANREKIHISVQNDLNHARSRIFEIENENSKLKLCLQDMECSQNDLKERFNEAQKVLHSNAQLISFLKQQATSTSSRFSSSSQPVAQHQPFQSNSHFMSTTPRAGAAAATSTTPIRGAVVTMSNPHGAISGQRSITPIRNVYSSATSAPLDKNQNYFGSAVDGLNSNFTSISLRNNSIFTTTPPTVQNQQHYNANSSANENLPRSSHLGNSEFHSLLLNDHQSRFEEDVSPFVNNNYNTKTTQINNSNNPKNFTGNHRTSNNSLQSNLAGSQQTSASASTSSSSLQHAPSSFASVSTNKKVDHSNVNDRVGGARTFKIDFNEATALEDEEIAPPPAEIMALIHKYAIPQ
eukprot:GDKJ01009217.1.p1 GENE.GDKJ01009217.1~~GDKJ01009217.1.p1  ORF type:complete len:783 (-),score=197.88 GDKJ01009217.1:199-2547(-)